MSQRVSRIVSGDESTVHHEPHIEGSRVTVRHVHARVEERGLRPASVADRLSLDVADVYEALAYYHRHTEEMAAFETRRQRAIESTPSLEPPTGRDIRSITTE